MKLEEHRRRAEVYRAAAEHPMVMDGMCIAIAAVIQRMVDPYRMIQFADPETQVFRRELAKEVGPLKRFYERMTGTLWKGGRSQPNPDRVLIRGEILTRAAEYHEACVAAGRTL